jgi:anti-sigma factor RsiW
MSVCDQFDKYRDGELAVEDEREFQSHLSSCEYCRAKMALLDNLVNVLRQDEPRPLDLADQIARKAFQRDKSWDALVVSWLRPGPVLAVLSLMLVLFSFLWLLPGNGQVSAYSEYEKLMDEADSINQKVVFSQVSNDNALAIWLQQEGNSE